VRLGADSGRGKLAVELHSGSKLLGIAEQAVKALPARRQLLQLKALRFGQLLAQFIPCPHLLRLQVESLDRR
jgi:hypothetical protein